MAFVLNDRVKETTTTTGTGTVNLGGAATGFETFVAGIGSSNSTYYCIVGQTTAEFEVGIGTVTDASPDTLSRTTILSSSNSDSAVDFSAGTKDVFCTLPAAKTIREFDTAINIPTGTTAERSSSAVAGDFRYNTTTGRFEGYSSSWNAIGGSNTFSTDIFAGDGSDTTFTLSQSIENENDLVVFIDGVFQAHNSYSVSGTTLTFSTAPANGRVITAYSVKSAVSGNNVTISTMTGDGSDTTLTLVANPVNENNVQVYIDGVYQNKDTFSVSGTTLTFSAAPPNGTKVEAITLTQTNINTATQLADADDDTKVQVEESSDEDTIRFDIAGAEDFTMSANSFNVLSGSSASFADDSRAKFGAGNDLQIYHDGSDSYINGLGTGNVIIRNSTDDADILFQSDNGSGSVTTYMTLDGSAVTTFFNKNTRHTDNIRATFGSSSDLQIYHDGTHSYVANSTNTLYLRTASSLQIENSDGSEDLATFAVNGAVTLFHDNSYKLATTSSGINIDGGIDIKDGSSLNGTITSSSNSLTLNARNTGVLLFQSGGNEKARIDGSGNFLAGTTSSSLSSSSSATGINLNPNGASAFVRDGGTALYINRLSSDGDITQFRKDGSTVGSISTVADDLLIGTGVCGLRFHDGTPAIQPRNTNGNANNDAIDIGLSGNRFKDLHLSGVVHTGGQLKGSAASSTKLILNATSTTTELHTAGNDGLIFKGSGDNELARIDSSGNLLVGGTTSPDTNGITIETTASSGGLNILSPTTGRGDIFFGDSGDKNIGQIRYAHSDNSMTFRTNASDRVTIDSSGNVGIGTTPASASSTTRMHIHNGTSTAILQLTGAGVGTTASDGTELAADDNGDFRIRNFESGSMQFYNNGSERMRIDSSGNLLVSKSASSFNTAGAEIRDSGVVIGTVDGAAGLIANRLTSDGTLIQLSKAGTTVGNIASRGGEFIAIGSGDTNLEFNFGSDQVNPSSGTAARDNAIDLGSSGARFDDIFATNGTIQTSDQNEKNTITNSDLGLDFVNKLSPKSYKFNGKTRTHYGLIAQDVETVLSDISKSTTDFAGFIKDDISEEQDGSSYRYGLRYNEFLAPLIKAIQEQQELIETLQAKVEALENG